MKVQDEHCQGSKDIFGMEILGAEGFLVGVGLGFVAFLTGGGLGVGSGGGALFSVFLKFAVNTVKAWIRSLVNMNEEGSISTSGKG